MRERNPELAHAGLLNSVYEERPKLLAMAVSLLANRMAAERVFNELVVAVQEQDREFSSRAELHDWAWTALRNRCLNLVGRGDYREVGLDAGVGDLVDAELSRRDAVELGDWAEALRPSLAQLTPSARWVVQLRYFDAMPALEVARLTGRNPSAIYGDLQRIYMVLNTCLSKRAPIGRMPDGPSRDREFQRLVFRYLDDQLTEAMAESLARQLLEDDARIVEFNDIRLHAALLYEFAAQVTPGEEHAMVFPQPANRSTGRNWAISIGVAAVVVLGAVGTLSRLYQEDNLQQESPVSFVTGADAEFAGTAPSAEGAMKAGRYDLRRGSVQLRMTSGASLNVEGPASFDVVSDNEIDLHRGTVTALVPKQAVGFVVDTPLARVRDLGTEFGVVVDDDTQADVVVFNGVVEVNQEGVGRQKLTTGEGLTLRRGQTPGKLQARSEAYRFPMMPAVSSPEREAGNLLLNPSFEIGPLSRAPHTGRQYRDVPSGWEGVEFSKEGAWEPFREPILGTVAGLAEATNATPYPSPAHGERYVFLRGDQIGFVQELGALEVGVNYELSVEIATQRKGTPGAAASRYLFGLWAGDTWIAKEAGTVAPADSFRTVRKTLRISKDELLSGAAVQVVLSASGMIFYDDVRLTLTPH